MITPYSVHLLAELYNLSSTIGQSCHDGWPKQLRNEVRHELRQNGYKIEEVDSGYWKTTKAVYIGEIK